MELPARDSRLGTIEVDFLTGFFPFIDKGYYGID